MRSKLFVGPAPAGPPQVHLKAASDISTHGDAPHIGASIVAGCSATVLAEGQPVAMVGSTATCMHPVTMGSFTVFVGL